MDVRRIVTGHTPEGKSVFVSDEMVPPIELALLPGMEFHRLWGADETVQLPDDGSAPSTPAYFPPVGGFRVGLFTVPPSTTTADLSSIDVDAALEAMERALPGMATHMEADDPGMHTTATVDFAFVVSGRCLLELDDGEIREIGPGDTVVQNGTRHRWSNPHDEPCRLVVVLVGADHKGVHATDGQ
jgi:mannose-6-phosphate isomerase-like protein (cupin superfamily)